MSNQFIHAVRWTCDECGTSVVGWVDELPEGWKLISISEPDNWNAKIGHVCGGCCNKTVA